jgi:putative tryptophan/tyrosine transport system substrate-binding protein
MVLSVGGPHGHLAIHIQRREFIGTVGGAMGWALAAHAQQSAMPVIGLLSPTSPDTGRESIAAFRQGLATAGYVEGRNVVIEYRWAGGQNDRPADLAQDRVAVIVALDGTPVALAAKAATQTIPIVFLIGADPIELGLVASLNGPGGNITGVCALSAATAAKRLQLLHEFMPAAADVAFLSNPTNPYSALEVRELQAAADVLGVRLLLLNASSAREIEVAFADLVAQRASAFLLGTDPFFMTERDQLVALANRCKVPAIHPFREDAAAGGLMSYGTSLPDARRLVGEGEVRNPGRVGGVAGSSGPVPAHQGHRSRPVQGPLDPGRRNAGRIQVWRRDLSIRDGEIGVRPLWRLHPRDPMEGRMRIHLRQREFTG